MVGQLVGTTFLIIGQQRLHYDFLEIPYCMDGTEVVSFVKYTDELPQILAPDDPVSKYSSPTQMEIR